MLTADLLAYLKDYLRVQDFQDYCVNGLQLEGGPEVRRLLAGVSVSERLFRHAREWGADAVLVHHGLFWKGGLHPFQLTGLLRDRVKLLLDEDIGLLAYHLPLDAHPEVGNNAVLARRLGLGDPMPLDLGLVGQLERATPLEELLRRIGEVCLGEPWSFPFGPEKVERLAVISGGAADRVELAAEQGAQALLVGNPTEPSIRMAEEMGITLIAGGHYNTERFGPQALAEHLAGRFDLQAEFFDVPNPV